ncbi:MAG: site-specific integrase [Bryobacterales bacterium]|nr:site-specific integrase [Bryobacterales bacterium]MDE0625438.1 site-specific integrase [Bryobacterales bacterium]
MTDSHPNALGRALRGFLADNLPRVRGLSLHTIRSFRAALKLLLVFLERHLRRPAATLDFPDLSREDLLAFLHHLEAERGNCAATRNVRLAALHSFARYATPLFPEHCGVASPFWPSPSSAPSSAPSSISNTTRCRPCWKRPTAPPRPGVATMPCC